MLILDEISAEFNRPSEPSVVVLPLQRSLPEKFLAGKTQETFRPCVLLLLLLKKSMLTTQTRAIDAVQHVRRMRGGAPSHLMRAADGHFYVVKFQNNPQHLKVLANEFLATI